MAMLSDQPQRAGVVARSAGVTLLMAHDVLHFLGANSLAREGFARRNGHRVSVWTRQEAPAFGSHPALGIVENDGAIGSEDRQAVRLDLSEHLVSNRAEPLSDLVRHCE